MLEVYDVLLKIIPLYLLIALGYVGGKTFHIDRKTIASVLFYLIIPAVFFDVALDTKIRPEFLLLPFILYFISIILCITYWKISKKIWTNGKANVIAFASGTGNTGYFGFPIALMLFDDHVVGIYMLANLGFSLYDYTVGAYIMARGKYTMQHSVYKIFRLPMIYAFCTGLLLNAMGYKMSNEMVQLGNHLKGAYVVLGMMMIGMGLSSIKNFNFDKKFITVFLSAKFIAAPTLVIIFIALDNYIFHIYPNHIYEALLLLSIVPPASNTVVFATLHDCYPEEASSAVAIGTLLAIIYVPTAIAILI